MQQGFAGGESARRHRLVVAGRDRLRLSQCQSWSWLSWTSADGTLSSSLQRSLQSLLDHHYTQLENDQWRGGEKNRSSVAAVLCLAWRHFARNHLLATAKLTDHGKTAMAHLSTMARNGLLQRD